MCYMKPVRETTVGVRELRQNLSVYLDQVKEGRTFTVTEHGHTVAELRPLRADADPLARLVAEGVIKAGRSAAKLPRPLRLSIDRPVSSLLDDLRDDRI